MTTRIPYPTSEQGTKCTMLMLLAFTLIDLTFLNSFVFAAQYDWIHNHWTVQPGLLVNNTYSSPYGSLKGVKGCQNGEDFKGIHDLKLYLSRFGYLNYQTNPNIPDPKKDNFYEELEAPIKLYQVYYHLNVTGTLDAPTLSKMVMPRCGFPNKESHHHSNGLLHIVSHYSFLPNRPKWPSSKRRLTYGFDHISLPDSCPL
ncbi:peptidase M10A, Metallopeptidase, catalytic domain protein [Artemisia annua]|uniref:Peptidase M10A, Metallopeptidase, catalytic domain protein n=1 Tax=Artemisia annua TaxID=35608 RepID=A0A2U1Q2I5_ARTAN|nr:peptidase M10A, Metallopeptidase, catalytic domain protein [Artemisia annua]